MTALNDDSAMLVGAHIPAVDRAAYPVRGGNLVRPLVDGEPAFRRICEAVEAANHRVWLTVAFLGEDFRMPDGRGSLFDVLDRAARRGLDVRVIFWRVNPETEAVEAETFPGRPAQLKALGARNSGFKARWDRGHKGYCQHQKTWIVDAGEPSEAAFVGGINLVSGSVVRPGHALAAGQSPTQDHDVYVEVVGPSATDVAHNFVQRWNQASDRAVDGGAWGEGADDDLPFPERLSEARGDSRVQIQRTVRAGHYADGPATPGGAPFDIAGGDLSIFAQYQTAIAAARRSIYIENQSFVTPEILAPLRDALVRGVAVTALVPADAYDEVRHARRRPEKKGLFDLLASLGDFEGFRLAGVAATDPDGVRHNVYIHAKVMLVDDVWATIGSCNIAPRSFFGDTEMNASIWDHAVVKALRVSLFAEHLSIDTAAMDDLEAIASYRRIALANRARRDAGNPLWEGSAFALDPATYGA